MLEDCEQMENEDIDLEREVNSEGESSPDIVRWGISMLEEQERDSTKLLDQLNTALNEVKTYPQSFLKSAKFWSIFLALSNQLYRTK